MANEHDTITTTPEPTETGSAGSQQSSAVKVVPDEHLSSEKIEAHPLPATLRDLGGSFRSHPVWQLVTSWTEQLSKESEQLKKDSTILRDELQEERVQSATLKERIVGLTKEANTNTLLGALGSAAIAFAFIMYQSHQTFFASVFFIVGLFLLGFKYFQNR